MSVSDFFYEIYEFFVICFFYSFLFKENKNKKFIVGVILFASRRFLTFPTIHYLVRVRVYERVCVYERSYYLYGEKVMYCRILFSLRDLGDEFHLSN